MILEVNGTPYDFFTSISANIRLDALSREFSFVATRTNGTDLPFRGGESCRVLDGDDALASGHIERLDVSYDQASHGIALSGRDNTGDIVDSSIVDMSDLSAPITLRRCVQRVIANIGADIDVIDDAGGVNFQRAADLIAPEPGQNAFDFLETLARRRQVLLTSNGDGDVVLTRAATAQSQGRLQNVPGASDNNIIASTTSYDGTGRYHNYQFVSALNPIALNLGGGATDVGEVVAQRASVTDASVREGRQLGLQSEASQSNAVNQERAQWEANLRRARGRLYSATVQGFREVPGGELWGVNKLIPVVDTFAGIDGTMLISGVAFAYSQANGSTTTLTLVPPEAYTLALDEPIADEVGDGFLS